MQSLCFVPVLFFILEGILPYRRFHFGFVNICLFWLFEYLLDFWGNQCINFNKFRQLECMFSLMLAAFHILCFTYILTSSLIYCTSFHSKYDKYQDNLLLNIFI